MLFQAMPSMTCLLWSGCNPAISHLATNLSMDQFTDDCHTSVSQSPPESPTYECMRLWKVHQYINQGTMAQSKLSSSKREEKEKLEPK